MKRILKSVELSPTQTKKPREKQIEKVLSVEAMKDPPDDQEMDADEDKTQDYACETSNRFAILPIIMPEPTVLSAPKNKDLKPQKIFVNNNRLEVLKMLEGQSNYVLENVRGGTNVIPSTYAHQKALIKLLNDKKAEYRSRPSPGERLKRFVLYGLNSDNEDQIKADLLEYGVKVEKIVQIKVKQPRYFDHCNYIIYVNSESGLTLATIQQAKFICHTQVKWANYIINGDGVSKCANCQQFGHPADYCKLKSRCGICAKFHRTSDCDLLLEKRAKNLKSINPDLLKCVHCEQHHTSGYTQCTERINYIMQREYFAQKASPKFINAPAPNQNPWTPRQYNQSANYPPLSRWNKQPRKDYQPTTNAESSNIRESPHQYNQAADHPPQGSQNNQPRKEYQRNTHANQVNNNNDLFSAGEISQMFHKILDIVDNCTSKQQQMRVMIDVITQYIAK